MATRGLLGNWLGDNPIYQGLDQRRNALSGLGMGLMTGKNFGEGLANGLNYAQQARQADDAYALRQEEQAKTQETLNQTVEWLRQNGQDDLLAAVDAGAMDPGQAWEEALKRMQPQQADMTANQNDYQFYANQEMQAGRPPMSFAEWVGGAGTDGGGTEYGLTPIWGQNPDGSFGYGVQGKDGSFQRVDTGGMTMLDPRSLAGERAFGAELGSAQGAAVAGAPGDITTAETALDLIDQIKNHEELGWATGPSAAAGLNNPILTPGRFAFQNLVDQAKSGAFLTAIQEMRGMGALSNAEGQTATQAITRMDTALSKDDFLAALADYERIVTAGLERATARLGTGPNVGSMPAASGQVLTFNPETGRLE